MLAQQRRKELSAYYATDLRLMPYAGNEADGLTAVYHLSTKSSTLYFKRFPIF